MRAEELSYLEACSPPSEGSARGVHLHDAVLEPSCGDVEAEKGKKTFQKFLGGSRNTTTERSWEFGRTRSITSASPHLWLLAPFMALWRCGGAPDPVPVLGGDPVIAGGYKALGTPWRGL